MVAICSVSVNICDQMRLAINVHRWSARCSKCMTFLLIVCVICHLKL